MTCRPIMPSMHWFFRQIRDTASFIGYLAGALAICGGLIWLWLFVAISLVREYDALAGVAFIAASAWFGWRYEYALGVPWRLWRDIWRGIDGNLD